MTLIKFNNPKDREFAIELLSHIPTWVISAHEDPMVLDLPRDIILTLYQKQIMFEFYHDEPNTENN